MPKFSVIIPVYNRPGEVDELLASLTRQTNKDFDVIVVDDGSEETCEAIAKKYQQTLALHYFYKPNSGPGDSRNFGCERAAGNFFIFFDSDCLVPVGYFEALEKAFGQQSFDAFGGPDREHDSFTPIQKAISYSMTSIFTTGGIRGGRQSIEKFHPRSFNMGFGKNVFEKTKGFAAMRFGEDIDLSIRIAEAGFKSILVPECFVFHKRRTNLKKFFKQVFNSGIARINLYKRHPKSLKLVHLLPSVFVAYIILSIPHAIYHHSFRVLVPLITFWILIFLDASMRLKSLKIGLLTIAAATVQLTGYGLGFFKSFWRRIILGKDEFHAFEKNFYK